MSKINIQGIVDNITSKTNVYTPIIEAIVNSIEAIDEVKNDKGKITISVVRENALDFDGSQPTIQSIEIMDNGIGFTQENRDSFDTFYGDQKKKVGGKGFGRFMFLKYFNDVKVDSIYKNGDGHYQRGFTFGKGFDIIINETNIKVDSSYPKTIIFLNNIKDSKLLDKGLETIARKLLEKLLTFFVDDNYKCPLIILKEKDESGQIILNDYLNQKNEIQRIDSSKLLIKSTLSDQTEEFDLKTFKIYFTGNQKSKISLTAQSREVTDTNLHNYIPEFIDDFYDEIPRKDNEPTRKNYIIKTYVIGRYLDTNVSLERETFNFDKIKADPFYPFSQHDIEKAVSEKVKELFTEDVHTRLQKKIRKVHDYINQNAPWHKVYLKDLNLTNFPYNINDEIIEMELQKVKFQKEIETKTEIKKILDSGNEEFEAKLNNVISKITEIGKSDLAHYVCNRRVVLELLKDTLRRREDGSAQLEKEIHNVIFPMVKDSTEINYEDHNLWLLDERLVFSDYIASDKKISKTKALSEPDLIIFDQKKCFRNGDNEFSNPLTIFEFKRPKRTIYKQEEDPVLQIANYLKEIKAGKYETPGGIETIKVNENTPVYGFVICDLTDKINEFATLHQLTISPDSEGYFGYHRGFGMYVEIISYKKLLKDASLRNKIFFKKLQLE